MIVALVTNDVFTSRADLYLRTHPAVLIMSDFAAAEFASVVARRVRTREITEQTVRTVFGRLDGWMIRNTERAETTAADVAWATAALSRLDLTLRTADAVNIAIAERVGSLLMTFDVKVALATKALGVGVAPA